MRILLTIYLFIICFSASGQKANFWIMNQSSSTTPLDSIKVNLDTTQLMTVSQGWVNITGDPHLNVFTVTNTSGAITVTTVSKTNWIAYSGGCAFPNNGNTSFTAFPAQAVKEVFYSNNGAANNFDQYNIAKPKFHVTGLKPGSTYTVTIGGSQTNNFTSNTEFRVIGSILNGPVTIDCKNNVSTVAKWTSVAPTAGGVIDIYVNSASGQELNFVSAFTIVEN